MNERLLNDVLQSAGGNAGGRHRRRALCALLALLSCAGVHAQDITGVWNGSYTLTMRAAPGGVVLGTSTTAIAWTWNFDEGWAEFGSFDPEMPGQGMLSVGFPFHVQDLGNADPQGDRASFTANGDGTYTLHHGFQIYNPFVGNPRTETTTTFRITRNGARLQVETLDAEASGGPDGIPGTQIVGVFPLTVEPDFIGSLGQGDDPGTDPGQGDPGTGPGAGLIGAFIATPEAIVRGQSFTLTWQAVRADSCRAEGAWNGNKDTAGAERLTPANSGLGTYTLVCSDDETTLRRSVNVLVADEIRSGDATGLVVGDGRVVNNSGTLTNLTNNGIVSGGALAGTVQNNGVLANLRLAAGTTVRGGTLRGAIQGSGTVTDTLLDVSALSADITLGAGTQITETAARNVTGLDLGTAVRGSDDALDTAVQLLVDADGDAWNLRELARRGINLFFGNSGTQVTEAKGVLNVRNGALGTAVASILPVALHTTDQPDGLVLSPDGDLLVSALGVETRFLPSPLDAAALTTGLQQRGATVQESANGLRQVQMDGNTLSLRLGLLADPATAPGGVLEEGAVIHTVGTVANPAGHRLLVEYPNGSTQEMLPYLHDVAALAAWIEDIGWSYTINPVNGQVVVRDAHGTVLGRGIPAYGLTVQAPTGQTTLRATTDLNGDGRNDWLFSAGAWSQAIYNLGTGQATATTSGSASELQEAQTQGTSAAVVTDQGGEPGAGNAADQAGSAGLSGLYVGEHMITMRGCPGVCVGGQEVVLGIGVRNSPWVWDFDNHTVLITGTTLTVGFNYEIQSLGNAGTGDARLTAPFTDNGDGTYTLHHGFQIYNPNVGNPRTDTTTKFRITVDADNPNLIVIQTLDDEPGRTPDGIVGTQIVGVFPLTVQPEFRGSARREGGSSAGDGVPDQVKEALGLNPDAPNGDTDGDGLTDVAELGALEAPLDSDGDGLIDALEPGDAAHDAQRIVGLALFAGIPGRTQENFPLAGSSVSASIGGSWRFTGAATGLMQLAATDDPDNAIPDTTLGDAGLDYQHGYAQFQLSGASSAEPVTLRLNYTAPLPTDKLLLYAATRVDGKVRYTLMARSDYRQIDAHTLEVTLRDNGPRDLDGSDGVLRVGFAPTRNTLGGYGF
ncbi:MAG TPA: hypothetical protein VNR18_13975 [Hyphomicrobiales bacterium]|nr:hypothetical protein [Hyphomicrobiales bacterium]